MKEATLQIQSVIYKNEIGALKKAVCGIANSLRNAKENGLCITGSMIYGDASPERILTEEDVKEFDELLPEEMTFSYKEFGMNSGTAKGHNLLAEDCSQEYMMIMNPDVIAAPRCLWELLRPFENPEVGMTEARQTPLEHAKGYDEVTGETEWASTACTIFRTQIFTEVNGFDADTFFMYCDDLDFSWRVRLCGYKIIYNPMAVIYHAKALSAEAEWLPTPAEVYYSAEAALLLAYKWSNPSRVKEILRQYDHHGNADEKRAAAAFRKRKQENRLPQPIDGVHRIGRFIDGGYNEMRFVIKTAGYGK